MDKKRRTSRNKRINPKFWIFCEGKTEKSYVEYLRAKYRLPIKIIPEITGSKISDKLIVSHISKKEKHEKDKIFSLYDADVIEVLQRLQQIKNTKLLASNPSTELSAIPQEKIEISNNNLGVSPAGSGYPLIFLSCKKTIRSSA